MLPPASVGIIRACIDRIGATMHCNAKTFGKPIAEHQLIQQMIAQMQQDLDIGELLVWKAGTLKNRGVSAIHAKPAWPNGSAPRPPAAPPTTRSRFTGPMDIRTSINVERHLRNTKSAVIYEGTTQIHTLMQAAYTLGKRQDRPLRCPMPAYDADAWQ